MDLDLQHRTPRPLDEDGDTVLDQIRGLYEQAKGEPRLPLRLPGPIGQRVKVRYRPTDDDFSRPGDMQVIDVALDTLIHCCDAILTRGDDGEWAALDVDGDPVRFDERLNILFGLGVAPREHGGTARQVVLAAYSGAPKPRAAVIGVFQRLSEWMAGARDVDEERLLGES